MEILRQLGEELPGEWSLRGRGMKSLLIGEPIGFPVRWIGGSKASSTRMHAGSAPSVNGFVSFEMGVFGLDMSQMPQGQRALDLGSPDDLDQARAFAHRALERMDDRSAERYHGFAEFALDQLPGGDPRDPHLRFAPGWRVVFDDGDPLAAIERIRQLRPPPPESGLSGFFDGLADRWSTGGRDAALAFMVERRDASLVEQGYGPDSVGA